MGWLRPSLMDWLRASVALLASGLPTLPERAPALFLLGPCAVSGALFALAGEAHGPLHAVVLALIGATLPLAVNHPGWAVVPLLLVDLSLADERMPALGMSLRLAVTLTAAGFAFLFLLRQGTFQASLGQVAARYVVVPAVLFVGIATVVNLLFSELAFVIKYLRYQLTLLATLTLIVLLVRDHRALRIVTVAAFLMAVVSAVVGVGQRIGGPFALHAAVPEDAVIAFGERVFGVSSSPVTLANNLVSVAVPALGLLAVAWSSRLRLRAPLLLGTALILVGAYLTTTRSALMAVAVGVVVILLLVEGQRRLVMSGLIVTLVGVFGVALATGAIDQRFLEGAEEDKSAASHVAVMQVALAVAMDNMVIGIGREHFEQVSRAYFGEVAVGGGAAQRAGEGAVGALRPHNDFLEVWSSWGSVGLLPYLAVFIGAFRNFLLARRSSDALIRGLAIGGAGGLAAYAVNSFFHNYLDSSVILWCYAGLSVVVVAIPQRRASRLAALRHGPIRYADQSPAARAA